MRCQWSAIISLSSLLHFCEEIKERKEVREEEKPEIIADH
jgi:hypothetical protein